ncbi:hypothetical protein [Marinomonas sp. TW1]|uniref:hypothetical protein n=1 Tax=Marinomonas sp. TW1 TaxID=1561203 RepID=UPI0007AF9C09|nr:hypothetical protein [Marinomonas sp. TW1]
MLFEKTVSEVDLVNRAVKRMSNLEKAKSETQDKDNVQHLRINASATLGVNGLLSKGRNAKALFAKGMISLLIASQLAACGTIIYPERRGQSHGAIDPGVAALNAVGLILFFVPGVVAFGVDFVTGSIYLPGGKTASLSQDELKQLKQGDDSVDVTHVRKVLAQRKDIALPEQAYTQSWNVVSMASKQSLQLAMSMPSEQLAMLTR